MGYFSFNSDQNFEEILKSIYKKGQESENISVIEFIEEIKKQFLDYTK